MQYKRASIKVFGRVQGVGFRYYTEKLATSLGITGYVKNLPDGSVYIVAEGDSFNLDLFIERVKRGPSLAHVDNIIVDYNDYKNEFNLFEIRF